MTDRPDFADLMARAEELRARIPLFRSPNLSENDAARINEWMQQAAESLASIKALVAERDAAHRAGWNDAREKAARWHDARADHHRAIGLTQPYTEVYLDAHTESAAEIRALEPEPPR